MYLNSKPRRIIFCPVGRLIATYDVFEYVADAYSNLLDARLIATYDVFECVHIVLVATYYIRLIATYDVFE